MIKNITLLFIVLSINACSTTVTGPVTGNKYNLDVGCTEDMQTYREQRNNTIKDIEREKMNKLDCPNIE
jgi:hypothetical protein